MSRQMFIHALRERQRTIPKQLCKLRNEWDNIICPCGNKKPILSLHKMSTYQYTTPELDNQIRIADENSEILKNLKCPFPSIFFRYRSLGYKWLALENDIKLLKKMIK